MPTLQQVRQLVAGTQALEVRGGEDDSGRHCWIDQVLVRFWLPATGAG